MTDVFLLKKIKIHLVKVLFIPKTFNLAVSRSILMVLKADGKSAKRIFTHEDGNSRCLCTRLRRVHVTMVE